MRDNETLPCLPHGTGEAHTEPLAAQAMERQGGRVRRIDEIRERLDKARPGLGEIDHAAEARKRIVCGEEWMEREGGTDVTNTVAALHAQVHATLALAEQQRIANLIALAAMDPDGLGQSAYSALAAMSPDRRRTVLAPDIAATLGIGDDDE